MINGIKKIIKTVSSEKVVSLLLGIFLFLTCYEFYLNIKSGIVAFWFDPARDLLLAKQNLVKFTLIGQPSGIPGFAYPPYWIWLLSLSQLISKDPRIILTICQTLPYLIIIPFVFLKFQKIFGMPVVFSSIVLLILGTTSYSLQLWNPNLAPLLFIVLSFIVHYIDKSRLNWILSGIVAGLIFSFHISFGIPVIIGTTIYHLANFKKSNLGREAIFKLGFYFLGLIATFLPFILFEIRHNFNQTTTIFKAFEQSFIYHISPVNLKGLSTGQIFQETISKFSSLFQISAPWSYLLVIILFVLGISSLVRKQKNQSLNSFIVHSLICLGTILFVYTTSKAPVWNYHFIGVEAVLFMFLLGLTLNFKFLRNTLFFSAIVVWAIHLKNTSFEINPYPLSTLASKEKQVETVYNDAGRNKFSVFAYSGAIYTFDYDYLFDWFGTRFKSQPINDADVVYLIIPPTKIAVEEDFIHYRSNPEIFKTSKIWNFEDGTKIIKRTKNEI